MKHLHKDLIFDKEYSDELFLKWVNSDTEYDYITWLKLMVMHRALGGASNKDIDILKKTIVVLINEIEK